ncbi:MAG: DUF1501 domain-containing protein [Phycisphaerae bacterium]|jgi:uncharacterized protein (DUF1501 family)|nr:DUF1501 domain-containing protein [Phycisphaerae bacterium]
MDPNRYANLTGLTRRTFLGRVGEGLGVGLGSIALASLMGESHALGATGREGRAPTNPLAPRPPHFRARAKAVISIHLAGSPSQHELFENKPVLTKHHGQPCPDEYLKGEQFAFIKGHPTLLRCLYDFQRHGTSGMEMSSLLPHLGSVADELCMLKAVKTDQFNHAPAQLLLWTGDARFGHPSMGSWLTYGLGSEANDLPGFVVLVSGDKTPDAGKSVWGSGFLPSVHQGVQCRASGAPVLYVNDPPGIDRAARRRMLDAVNDLNRIEAERSRDPETLTRIAQYELAYRMQMSVPDAMDITREPPEILEEYGAVPGQGSIASSCLLARRLVERGVRFVQIFDWGWDGHGTGPNDDLVTQLPKKCGEMDRPVAALIRDLKRRGLLDETLVTWGGEFGRTPVAEFRDGKKDFLGRDHHPHAFTMLMAGGGVKGGFTYGETDDLGYFATKDPIPVNDLQATILHLLGLDHQRLTYFHSGLNQRLTGVTKPSRVHESLLA